MINNKANELFYTLKSINSSAFATTDNYNQYFLDHHLGHRLFFSIQNSAHILYESVKLCNKPVNEINAIDYGAGLGTLFMLGGMLGFKRFDYNDHLPEWKDTAVVVCNKAGSVITDFVIGDINAVSSFSKAKDFRYDIILSRNVIEHIYSLQEFYEVIFAHNPKTVIYSTTTANYHNPAMHFYHRHIHKKNERLYYKPQRINEIQKLHPSIETNKLIQLVELTRGKGQHDFSEAVNNFIGNMTVNPDSSLRTNTCDCITGVWCEHLLTKKEYEIITAGAGFKMLYTGGYWDTHYSSTLKNLAGKFFNAAISLLGKNKAVLLSPFVNVVAYN
ncbi:MAG: hypothetical protein QM791_08900 [Ferruginibacter sp.]